MCCSKDSSRTLKKAWHVCLNLGNWSIGQDPKEGIDQEADYNLCDCDDHPCTIEELSEMEGGFQIFGGLPFDGDRITPESDDLEDWLEAVCIEAAHTTTPHLAMARRNVLAAGQPFNRFGSESPLEDLEV